MRTEDFDFHFPENLIAYHPLARGESRMMVVDKQVSGRDAYAPALFTHTSALADFLDPGDALVLNDTKVLRARLIGESAAGGRCEALLLAPAPCGDPGKCRWEAMVKPGKRFRPGDRALFSQRLIATVAQVAEDGTRILEFDLDREGFLAELELTGRIPLPPYIKREASAADALSYQSVFAAHPGSVAAPTASLHLSESMLADIRAKGVDIRMVTLHVGAGTFKPVQSETLAGHAMHSESYVMSAETAAALNGVRRQGRKIWAVGTTAARVLETQARGSGTSVFEPGSGQTSIFIHPGYAWKGLDGLLTNFHWPKSTLFMLVSSLLGPERAKQAYAEAFAQGMRLFSYGDAMLIR
ncbi:MAG: tRNA preQ1(34) S-adenosylmethionine ribosyltransferase-isomerase QueA [Fibrobacteria bacterium]